MRRLVCTFLAPAWLVVAGCTGNTLPAEADATRGRAALKSTLDMWAKGGTMDDLKNASPAIVAFDPDWQAGSKLAKYEIDDVDSRVGVDLLVKVKLFLAKADGKTQEKTVNFSIAIGAQTVVLRQT